MLVGLQVLGVGRPGASDADAAPPVLAPTAGAAQPEPESPASGPLTDPTVNGDADPRGTTSTTPPRVIVEPVALPARPIAVRIPAIEVDAEVVSVGLEPDGAMEIPSDVRTVGWFDPFAGSGLAPGEPGTAVIAGHVDSRVQGRGAFWLLRDLKPGDIVQVLHADGEESAWRIDEVVRYPKDDIPIEDIFTFEGPSRLALITCGGEFDRSIGSYLENYVVTAVPAMGVPGLPGTARTPGAFATSPSLTLG
jgi:hypothetical protein